MKIKKYNAIGEKLVKKLIKVIRNHPVNHHLVLYWEEAVVSSGWPDVPVDFSDKENNRIEVGFFDSEGNQPVEAIQFDRFINSDILYEFQKLIYLDFFDDESEENYNEDLGCRIKELFTYHIAAQIEAEIGKPVYSITHDDDFYFNYRLRDACKNHHSLKFDKFLKATESVDCRIQP